MKKFIVVFVLLSLLTDNSYKESIKIKDDYNKNNCLYNNTMKQDILSLMAAYPEYIKDLQIGSDGNVFLIMKSGRRIIYDDKKNKSNEQKLVNPDIQDMMEQIYPISRADKLSSLNYEPGRARVYELLKEVYGNSRNDIEKNLVNVSIVQSNCQFNKNNMASTALKTSMKELNTLAGAKHQISTYLYPISGTYNYRVISGTNRLSPHSFGIAIDLASNNKDYWKWATREEGQKRLTAYPYEIVSTFEKNNFIWGGKWGHFDILHFEYRPEIIFKARYFADKKDLTKKWYDGVQSDNPYIRECIDKIENTLYGFNINSLN